MKNIEESKVYPRIFLLGLDELFDTRLGTLFIHFNEMFEEYFATEVETGNYHRRLRDEFGPVSQKAFREAYAKRDLKVLEKSVITNAEIFVVSMLRDAFEEAIKEPFRPEPFLTINVWPYEVDQEFLDTLLSILQFKLRKYFDKEVKIVFLNTSPENFTIDMMAKFKGVLMYDFFDWLELHQEAFKKTILSSVTVFAPALISNEEFDISNLANSRYSEINPIEALETLASFLIPTSVVDVKLFSIFGNMINKDTVIETKESVDLDDLSVSPIEYQEQYGEIPDPRDNRTLGDDINDAVKEETDRILKKMGRR